MNSVNINSLIEEIMPTLKSRWVSRINKIKLEGLLTALIRLPIEEVRDSKALELLLILQTKRISKKLNFLVNHLSMRLATTTEETEPWTYLDDMFGGDEVIFLPNGETFNVEGLRKNKIKEIKSTFQRSNENMVVEKAELVYHSDGRFEFNPISKVQCKTPEGLPNLFTDSARKFLNDLDDEEAAKNEAT